MHVTLTVILENTFSTCSLWFKIIWWNSSSGATLISCEALWTMNMAFPNSSTLFKWDLSNPIITFKWHRGPATNVAVWSALFQFTKQPGNLSPVIPIPRILNSTPHQCTELIWSVYPPPSPLPKKWVMLLQTWGFFKFTDTSLVCACHHFGYVKISAWRMSSLFANLELV